MPRHGDLESMKSLVVWMTVFSLSMLVPASVLADELFAWRPAASPKVPYFWHTLTVLESGDVLAVGNAKKTLMAEVYHPGLDQWTPVKGAPHFARFAHEAVKLPGGQVLLCGGAIPLPSTLFGPLVEDAEIYDEQSGEFQLVGKMKEKRHGHRATAFIAADGTIQVLVTGGNRGTTPEDDDATASAEIYDPITREWRFTEPMSVGRRTHTATWLNGVGVLVTGGRPKVPAVYSPYASAEIWDPRTGKWRHAAPMGSPRTHHSATPLSNGKVFVAAGSESFEPHVRLASAELYDPERDEWASLPPMRVARDAHQSVLLAGDRVLIVGGNVTAGKGFIVDGSTEVFDAGRMEWFASPAMLLRSSRLAAVRVGESMVLAVGVPQSTTSSVGAETLQLLPPGAACEGDVECGSGFCTERVCCDRPCQSRCATCLAARGAVRDGVCFERPCAPYSCEEGAGPVCLTGCFSAEDCAVGYVCERASGDSTLGDCVEPRSTFVMEGCALAGGVSPAGGDGAWFVSAVALFAIGSWRRRLRGRCRAACVAFSLAAAGCDGEASPSLCGSFLVACDDRCVDTRADPLHCGACQNRCETGELCLSGECSLECAGGTTRCGDHCVDLQVDPSHCGACGATCAGAQICKAGACALPAGMRSYIFPGVTAAGGVHVEEPDFVLMADGPAVIHYTTDGSAPSPGSPATKTGESPVTIPGIPSSSPQERWIRWFADYDLLGREVEVHSYLSVTEPTLRNDYNAVAAARLGPEGVPLVVVSQGDSLRGEMDYNVWRSAPKGYCPGCYIQILAGLQGKDPEALACEPGGGLCCRSSSTTKFALYPGTEGSFAFDDIVTVPPGRYVIRWWLDLAWSCAGAKTSVTNDRWEEIGLVVVR
jgi:hypothetical protein